MNIFSHFSRKFLSETGMSIRPNARTSYDLSDDILYIPVGQIVPEIFEICIGHLFNDQVREWPLQCKIDAAIRKTMRECRKARP